MDEPTFAERLVSSIVDYRAATGISNRELARRADIREGTLRRIDFDHLFEKGSPTLTLRSAKRIEDAMRRYPATNGADNGTR